MNNQFGLIHKYRPYLPVKESDTLITLGEGNTPLIPLTKLCEKKFKGIEVYAKFEGMNPTGSFKDRGMTMAITNAYNEGSKAVICASTGNTSAAAAAYATRAKMACFILIPEGKIAMGKMAQAMMYGAITLQVSGNFDDAMNLVKQVGAQMPISIVNSINPYRIQGQKTASFEIIDFLKDAPDYHYLPVGNAGNISAHWTGYNEYHKAKKSTKLPKMVGYQADGSAPFMRGEQVKKPETLATAIRIGNPQSWDFAHQVIAESNGHFAELSDQKILEAQYLLASEEGVFCEPASAASIGGLLIDYKNNKIKPGSTIVCTLTGNGIKDPDIAITSCKDKVKIISTEANFQQVMDSISQHV